METAETLFGEENDEMHFVFGSKWPKPAERSSLEAGRKQE
jgi:hypothetical protein